ncbi:hypothetical protein VL04_11470 [Chromobacterium violaceum]|nr:hypothetical protein VK93_09055 [Chromobacterium violaceum]KMN84864.1 hypothetical protein VL02_17360 [Chromobacterium violaceum]KMN90291.1 hypothetical protein VL04_11470 [Chromobacterium violaceum]KMO01897.1 hypothetical protein VL16_20985 [Chromobacterium violaceum]
MRFLQSAARMMIWIAGAARWQGGDIRLLYNLTRYPGHPASLAFGYPPVPARPEARLNSLRANLSLGEAKPRM